MMIDGWPEHVAAPGFADRVTDRLAARAALRRRTWITAVAAAATGAAVAAAAMWWLAPVAAPGREAAAGSTRARAHVAAQRRDGARAAGEPGAELRWRAAARVATAGDTASGHVVCVVDEHGGGAAAAAPAPDSTADRDCACAAPEPAFEPGAAVLASWAEQCRLHFDVAPIGYDRGMLDHFLAELDAAPDERAAIVDSVRAVEARADLELVRIYVDATGDEAAAGKAPLDWMFDEVLRSAAPDEPAEVRRRLARERAGLAQPPADLRTVTPYEEMVRALQRSGDDLERAIAARLGPERSRALRRRHGGWPGLRWNVAGCPAPSPE